MKGRILGARRIAVFSAGVDVKKDALQPQPSGIPLNELDKFFYSWELLGARPVSRILFEFSGGHIDVELLRRAYSLEIKCRPVLNATIHEYPARPGWDVRWLPAGEADPSRAVKKYDFTSLSAGEAEERSRQVLLDPLLDYSSLRNPPFCLALCALPKGRHKLVAFIHHAVTDAYGIGLILGDIFIFYNRLAAGDAADAPAASRTPRGAPSSLLPSARSARLKKIIVALAFVARHAVRTGFRSPAKVFCGKSTFAGRVAAVQREVSEKRLFRYLAAAKRQRVTLNVLLVAAQITALERWKRGRGEPCGLISIEVHKNLRREEQDFRELSNKFSTYLVVTQPGHRAGLNALVEHVAREQEHAFKSGMAEKIIGLLWPFNTRIGAKTLPRWGNAVFSNPQIGDSSQVTNVGRVWADPGGATRITSLGSAEITGCYMAALPSPSIGNYSSFVTFRNRLFISFNYFEWAMSDAEARRFVDIFQQALDDLADLQG